MVAVEIDIYIIELACFEKIKTEDLFGPCNHNQREKSDNYVWHMKQSDIFVAFKLNWSQTERALFPIYLMDKLAHEEACIMALVKH